MIGRVAVAGTAGLAALVALPVVVLAGAAGGGQPPPTAAAIDDIPPALLSLYQAAAAERCPTLPWSVLAAIGKLESDHARSGGARLHPDGTVAPPIIGPALDGSPGRAHIADTDGGRYDHHRLYDRAVGPMQLLPATWRAYGIDASGDGQADPHNAVDAIHTAAVYLCRHGGHDPDRVADAVWAYNHSRDYVQQVLDLARRYAADATGVVEASPTLIAVVLHNPRLDIYPAGRADIAAGRIDARVLTVLQLASERHALQVSSLKTGHSRCVGGGDRDPCRVSHHWHGRAADISAVDGRPVHAGNHAALHLAVWLGQLEPPLLADEIGTPWATLTASAPYFADAAHADHIHFAFDLNAD